MYIDTQAARVPVRDVLLGMEGDVVLPRSTYCSSTVLATSVFVLLSHEERADRTDEFRLSRLG